ncbi:hypothetical protein [Actinomadura algeriensis]|uniref:Uncharacterized protein n=1 Tax=Actinomadura algeriensis TaxID=1679523 RepID=A0ABR9JVK1_9ACTN|nr:hypothetical protein [Actinomadura algeriensis]MBE1534406.1 hypothetical protein [Actinomadura algeriensis]
MINTLFVNTPSRNATRPGASIAYSPVSVDTPCKPRLRGGSAVAGGREPFGGSISGNGAIHAERCAELGGKRRDLRDLRDLRDVRRAQRFQDEQGWSVSEQLLGGMTIQASATAREGAPLMGGVSGPHPWRRPV